jgi:hypothetical protein
MTKSSLSMLACLLVVTASVGACGSKSSGSGDGDDSSGNSSGGSSSGGSGSGSSSGGFGDDNDATTQTGDDTAEAGEAGDDPTVGDDAGEGGGDDAGEGGGDDAATEASTPPADGSACATGTCSGCCDTSGVCQVGSGPSACGVGGTSCVDCGTGICSAGICNTTPSDAGATQCQNVGCIAPDDCVYAQVFISFGGGPSCNFTMCSYSTGRGICQ